MSSEPPIELERRKERSIVVIAENEIRLEAAVSIVLHANICIKSSKIDKARKSDGIYVLFPPIPFHKTPENQNYH